MLSFDIILTLTADTSALIPLMPDFTAVKNHKARGINELRAIRRPSGMLD